MHACNPSTWEAEARGSQVQIPDQHGLHNETLSQKIIPLNNLKRKILFMTCEKYTKFKYQ
jgi:hypothetical protein